MVQLQLLHNAISPTTAIASYIGSDDFENICTKIELKNAYIIHQLIQFKSWLYLDELCYYLMAGREYPHHGDCRTPIVASTHFICWHHAVHKYRWFQCNESLLLSTCTRAVVLCSFIKSTSNFPASFVTAILNSYCSCILFVRVFCKFLHIQHNIILKKKYTNK